MEAISVIHDPAKDDYTYSDEKQFRRLSWNWARSYDTKVSEHHPPPFGLWWTHIAPLTKSLRPGLGVVEEHMHPEREGLLSTVDSGSAEQDLAQR